MCVVLCQVLFQVPVDVRFMVLFDVRKCVRARVSDRAGLMRWGSLVRVEGRGGAMTFSACRGASCGGAGGK